MANGRGFFALASVAFAAVALLTPASFADSNARIVRLSDVEGSVQIDRNTGHGFEKAVQNMPITQGVRLESGMTGRAEVEFENGSVLRLAEESSVEFSNLSLRSSGDQVTEIRLGEGHVYLNFRHKGDSEFRIWAGNRAIDFNKDVRARLIVDRGQVEIAVFKGEIKIQGPTETAKIKKNETLTLDLADGARYELAKGVSRYPADDYNEERDQYLEQYASTSHDNSPYAYGYSDLNRYGSFFYVPGYGNVWRPAGFSQSWDPFNDGYWALYPGSGYVWVSGYQWGWTPYRFGSWTFVPTYGWCWQPGHWNNWNTGVNVHNPPAGWRNPSPPPPGGGTTVVVGQPRGPRTPRMLEVDDLAPRTGRPRPGPVTRVPGGQANQARDLQQPQPSTAMPTANQPSPRPDSQPARLEPIRPSKMSPDAEVRGASASRQGSRPPQQAPPANPAPAPPRQMSAPAAPAPHVERSAPAPAPRMQSAPPPMRTSPAPAHSGGGRPSKTSPN
jgi:Family of unknown function (DUF6600)/FecR protein